MECGYCQNELFDTQILNKKIIVKLTNKRINKTISKSYLFLVLRKALPLEVKFIIEER